MSLFFYWHFQSLCATVADYSTGFDDVTRNVPLVCYSVGGLTSIYRFDHISFLLIWRATLDPPPRPPSQSPAAGSWKRIRQTNQILSFDSPSLPQYGF